MSSEGPADPLNELLDVLRGHKLEEEVDDSIRYPKSAHLDMWPTPETTLGNRIFLPQPNGSISTSPPRYI